MAENSLSQAVSFINDNSTMEIDLTTEGRPAARSDIVAYHFKRNHKDVLRDIRKLRAKCPESFYQLNFEPTFREVPGPNGSTRQERAYWLTRDGFTLLVMGFAGAEAVKWKLRYIEAFNTLETAALKHQADLARESGYLQGLDEGRASAAPLLDETRYEAARLIWSLGPKDKRRLRSVVRYRTMGLGINSIAKLLDISKREAFQLVKAADVMKLLPTSPARPVQGNLLEVGA